MKTSTGHCISINNNKYIESSLTLCQFSSLYPALLLALEKLKGGSEVATVKETIVPLLINQVEVCYFTKLPGSRLHIVDGRMIYEREAVGGMVTGKGNRSTRRKHTHMPILSRKISHLFHKVEWGMTQRKAKPVNSSLYYGTTALHVMILLEL
jgi:hypothetical protein